MTTLTARSLALAGLLTAALAAPAMAGECPADKIQADAMAPGATEPAGVTDDVLASIDLDAKPGFQGNVLRMRKLVVQPGGVVPWHSHDERPANIYVVDGSITEFRSNCAVPILHVAGDAVAEFGALSHWWKNDSDKPAVLISADIFADGMTDHSM